MNNNEVVCGARFATRKECTSAIQDFAFKQGKRAVIVKAKSGGNNFIYRCSSDTICSFYVKVARSRSREINGFYISSCSLEHNGCTGSKNVTERQANQSLAVRALVAAFPNAPAKTIQKDTQSLEGTILPTRMTYRVRETLLSELSGSYEQSFQKTASLLSLFCQSNPTSHFDFRVDENGRFKCAFLSHPYSRSLLTHGQKILGIDGAFMKHGRYDSVMLVLVGRDGNWNNVTLAIICTYIYIYIPRYSHVFLNDLP